MKRQPSPDGDLLAPSPPPSIADAAAITAALPSVVITQQGPSKEAKKFLSKSSSDSLRISYHATSYFLREEGHGYLLDPLLKELPKLSGPQARTVHKSAHCQFIVQEVLSVQLKPLLENIIRENSQQCRPEMVTRFSSLYDAYAREDSARIDAESKSALVSFWYPPDSKTARPEAVCPWIIIRSGCIIFIRTCFTVPYLRRSMKNSSVWFNMVYPLVNDLLKRAESPWRVFSRYSDVDPENNEQGVPDAIIDEVTASASNDDKRDSSGLHLRMGNATLIPHQLPREWLTGTWEVIRIPVRRNLFTGARASWSPLDRPSHVLRVVAPEIMEMYSRERFDVECFIRIHLDPYITNATPADIDKLINALTARRAAQKPNLLDKLK